MPTYEYACAKCGIVEAFQSMKDEALTKCPQCKRGKVTRLFSGGAGLIFKGSGFWETDYNRSSDYKAKAKADGGDGGSSGKSDNASDPAPDSKSKPATKKVDDKSTPAPATPAPVKPSGPAKRDS